MVDVRAQILSAATRRFAARGFDGTSLQAIADDVGIRKPSLLYHFPSKEELRRSVLDRVLVHWNDVLPRILMAATAGDERFEGVIREMIGFFSEDPDRARLIIREVLDRPEDMKALLAEHVRPWIEVVAEYIRTGQETGEVHADVDPEAYVLEVINLVIGGMAVAEGLEPVLPANNGEGARERHVRELVRVAKSSLFTGRGPKRREEGD